MFTYNLLLALMWVSVTEWFAPANLLFGFLVGYLVLVLAARALRPSTYGRRTARAALFLLFYIKEIVTANIRVAYYVLSPLRIMKPAIVAVPLEPMSDIEQFILLNLITLTPGTLTLDISDDRTVMYIHVMNVSDPERFRREIKQGYERRLLELTR